MMAAKGQVVARGLKSWQWDCSSVQAGQWLHDACRTIKATLLQINNVQSCWLTPPAHPTYHTVTKAFTHKNYHPQASSRRATCLSHCPTRLAGCTQCLPNVHASCVLPGCSCSLQIKAASSLGGPWRPWQRHTLHEPMRTHARSATPTSQCVLPECDSQSSKHCWCTYLMLPAHLQGWYRGAAADPEPLHILQQSPSSSSSECMSKAWLRGDQHSSRSREYRASQTMSALRSHPRQ